MTSNPADAPRWTPPRWMNRLMIFMLKTPGLQRVVGKGTALLTYTGRRTGKAYTIPVSYLDLEDRILVTCHRSRQWWRNLHDHPEVTVRLVGRNLDGVAATMDDPDNALGDFIDFIEAQPVVAKISDIPLDDRGKADRDRARQVLGYTVVTSIKLERASK